MKTNTIELGRAIKQLQYLNHRRLEIAFREIGTTLAQWDALRSIHENPDVSAHALAEDTFQTDQSFGTLAIRLIAKGLIERKQGAGRALTHSLTSKGQLILAQAMVIAGDVVDDSFKYLSESERAILLPLVQKVLLHNKVGKG